MLVPRVELQPSGKYTSPMDPICLYDPMGLKTYPSHTPGVHPKTRKNTQPKLGLRRENGSKTWAIPKTWAKVLSDGEGVKMAVDMISMEVRPQKMMESSSLESL